MFPSDLLNGFSVVSVVDFAKYVYLCMLRCILGFGTYLELERKTKKIESLSFVSHFLLIGR